MRVRGDWLASRYTSWMGFFHPADGYFEQHLERRAMVKPQ